MSAPLTRGSLTKEYNCISREPRHRFRDDQIQRPVQSVGDHTLEALALGGGCGRQPLVRVDGDELPVFTLPDVFGIIIHLGLEAGLLLIFVCRHASVSRDPALGTRIQKAVSVQINGSRYEGHRPLRYCTCHAVPPP